MEQDMVNQNQERTGKVIFKEEIEQGIRSIMEGQEFKKLAGYHEQILYNKILTE